MKRNLERLIAGIAGGSGGRGGSGSQQGGSGGQGGDAIVSYGTINKNYGPSSNERKGFGLLNPVHSAAYDSSARQGAKACLPNTRVEVLKMINIWFLTTGTFLFWLNGAAGTGKSTIAQSVALDYLLKKVGASFFFSRDQQERSETKFLIQTLAFQLGNLIPALKAEIAKALEDASILNSTLQRQFQKLIIEPIIAMRNTYLSTLPPILIVLDALDECDDGDQGDTVSLLIEMFVDTLKDHRLPLKIFITSRPELHIRATFASNEVRGVANGLILHDIAPIDVRGDIKYFVQYELRRIEELRGGQRWFSERDISALVDMAGGLFIVAATAIKFVSHRRADPAARLGMVLEARSVTSTDVSNIFENLDCLYRRVLEQAIIGVDDAGQLERLRRTIGAILLSFSRLSVLEMSGLLQIDEKMMRFALDELHSIIYIPAPGNQDAIRTFHASFHDFMTNEQRCTIPRLYVHPSEQHAEMTRRCLQKMTSLKRDPCNLCNSSKLNHEYDDLSKIKQDFFPGELQYACLYWTQHLRRCTVDEPMIELISKFSLSSILYWIEALSLMGELSRGLESLREAQSVLSLAVSPPKLIELLHDTERFLLAFYDVIAMSAAHIYYSALPFTPRESLLYQSFVDELKDSPQVLLGVRNHWDACLRVISHRGQVNAVAISHDGTRIISGSDDDTVCIWDAGTGSLLQELTGHSDWVRSVAISHDGTRIISGSDDDTVRIWDAGTGSLLQELTGHSDPVTSVAISHDGTCIISGSYDKTVRIWDAGTGSLLQELTGHSDWVRSVAISHDGTRIISGSYDNTARIWDAGTGSLLQELTGHSDPVTSVAISHDGTRIISGSYDNTARIWDAGTGSLLQELTGHSGLVSSVAISHDGTRIISGSYDKTVRIWDAGTGSLLQELTGHSGSVSSVAISHDGTRIISGSEDETVRIWDAGTGTLLQELTGHSGWVTSVAISHDGTRIISGSDDNTVRIWDAGTGSLLQELTGHSNPVTSVAISHDGTRIISGSIDKTVRIWDAGTGSLLQELTGPSDLVYSVAISHDGTQAICNDIPFPIALHAQPRSSLPAIDTPLPLCFEEGWIITRDDRKRLCWVPPEYRGEFASSSHLVALGAKSGVVTIIHFVQ